MLKLDIVVVVVVVVVAAAAVVLGGGDGDWGGGSRGGINITLEPFHEVPQSIQVNSRIIP
jgi:hypothetical protein